jgi:hypothetical protein
MATPANRAKIRLVRGDYADIEASIADLVDGELCYAKDRNQLYMVEGTTLTELDYLANTDIDEAVQDAIASALSGGSGITVVYDDDANTIVIDLDDTTVTPGTYGSSSAVAQVTIDQQGRVTSASEQSIDLGLEVGADSGTVQTILLPSETLTISGGAALTTATQSNGVQIDLDDTAVTPGTYGSSSSIPSITVDQQGRITSASSSSFSASLDVSADGGTPQVITLGEETLSITGDTGITTTTTTNGVKIDLDDTSVTAGSYGSGSAIPTIVVDGQGRITSASTTTIGTSLGVSADSGTAQQIIFKTETLGIFGGTGLSSITGTNSVTINLDNTAVTPGTYGSGTAIPNITVDAQGRITNVTTSSISTDLSIAGDNSTSDTITVGTDTLTFVGDTGITATVGTGAVTIDLDDTAVTPGTYGSSSAIPSITVDQQGRITGVSTSNITTSLSVTGDTGSETIDLGSESLLISGGTGLSSVAATNSVTVNLDDTTVTAGSYGSASSVGTFTVDSQGRLTAAGSTGISITHAAVTDFDDSVREVTGIDQTFEPMGHAVRLDSVMSFNAGTRTFVIQPTSTSYDVWCKGIKYTKTTSESVTIPNTTGLFYIYFNESGVLSYRTSYFDWDDDTPTAYLYWNASIGAAPYFADERHGIALDWATHEYLHRTRGAVIANGFSINNYTTTGSGSLDSHAQIDLGGGTFFDEDLEVAITHSDTPTANTWEQDLQGPAKIPAFYILDTAWIKDPATNFPLKQGTVYPVYNSYNGTSWSVIDAGANRYIVNFLIATNNLNEPVISIIGQDEYSNIGDAEAAQFGGLALGGFPSVEFRPLYKLIFQVGSYANTPKARLRSVIDIREISSAGTGQAIGSDHGILSGLGDDDHPQYLHVTSNRASVTANITTSGTLATTNTTASTSSSTGALVVAGGAGIGGNLFVEGNLTIKGDSTTIETETIVVEDANIQLGTVTDPSDITANGGGITLLGASTKTLSWSSTTSAWTSSEHFDLASGKSYYINANEVLNSTTLGSSVVSSSLTSVGTLTSGTWNAATIGYTYGGTGHTAYTDGQLLIGKTDGSLAKATLTAGSNVSISNADGSITINSTDTTYSAGDGLDLSGTSFSLDLKANGGLAIESTELALSLGDSSITGVLSVANGGTGQSSYADGELLIGNTTGNTLTKAALTAGTNVTIENGNGSITISATDTNTTYTAGDGLDLTGTEFSADLKDQGGIEISAGELALNLGHSSIVGTLGVADGGTGQSSYADGEILIGNGSTGGLAKTTLTAGANVSISNGNGTITISSTDTDTTYTAGDGINLTGTAFSADLKANGGLVIEAGEITVDLSASSITGTLAVDDGGTGLTSVAKGSVLVANTLDTLSALDGGGTSDGILVYDATTDTVSWATEIDAGSY